MTDSFYAPLGDDRWQATVHTTGPWDPRAQHGGPPSALLSRAMQRVHPRDDMMITRFTCEILRPIPVGELTVTARRVHPGLTVELLEASMSAFWGRMLYPLVPDEEPSPVERALVIADSGNGASLEIDIARWFSVNTELTVHLHHEPVGEWICLDAKTTLPYGGTGIATSVLFDLATSVLFDLATSVLFDLDGPVGVGAQALLIAQRPVRQPQPA